MCHSISNDFLLVADSTETVSDQVSRPNVLIAFSLACDSEEPRQQRLLLLVSLVFRRKRILELFKNRVNAN
jgi:hypothetical protein